ncbi:MAG: hypothetical protein GY838_05340, partial [bacterium]|nr:hypothetical protein [bacterium]
VTATASNLGSEDVPGLELTVRLIEPSALVLIDELTQTVDLLIGQVHTVSWSPDTANLELKPYVVTFVAEVPSAGESFTSDLDSASLIVDDLSSPSLTIIAPSPGLVCDIVEVAAEVADNLSGVLNVSYQIDSSGQDLPLPLANPYGSADLYGATWTLLPEHDGTHEISLFAEDFSGNRTAGQTVLVDADAIPPVLSVNTVPEGMCATQPLDFAFSATDNRLLAVTASLNGQPYTSGQLISDDDSYELVVVAADTCGHETVAINHFVIDTLAPQIDVQGVTDGGVHGVGVTVTWSVTDDNLSLSGATLDGGPVANQFTIDDPGLYQLYIHAVDCAGTMVETTIDFEVIAMVKLSGAVAVSPSQVEPPQPLQITGTARNDGGGQVSGIVLRTELVEPTSGQVLASHEEIVTLAPGAEHAVTTAFAT